MRARAHAGAAWKGRDVFEVRCKRAPLPATVVQELWLRGFCSRAAVDCAWNLEVEPKLLVPVRNHAAVNF